MADFMGKEENMAALAAAQAVENARKRQHTAMTGRVEESHAAGYAEEKDLPWEGPDGEPLPKRPRGRPPGKMTTQIDRVYDELGPAEKKVFDHLAGPFQLYYVNLAITNESLANGLRRAPSHARAGFVALRDWLAQARSSGELRIDTDRVSAPHLHSFIRDRALEQAAQERPHEILSAANADPSLGSSIDSVAALSERALEVAKAKIGKGVGNGTLCRWARPSTSASAPFTLAKRMLQLIPALTQDDLDVPLPPLLGRDTA